MTLKNRHLYSWYYHWIYIVYNCKFLVYDLYIFIADVRKSDIMRTTRHSPRVAHVVSKLEVQAVIRFADMHHCSAARLITSITPRIHSYYRDLFNKNSSVVRARESKYTRHVDRRFNRPHYFNNGRPIHLTLWNVPITHSESIHLSVSLSVADHYGAIAILLLYRFLRIPCHYVIGCKHQLK